MRVINTDKYARCSGYKDTKRGKEYTPSRGCGSDRGPGQVVARCESADARVITSASMLSLWSAASTPEQWFYEARDGEGRGGRYWRHGWGWLRAGQDPKNDFEEGGGGGG